MVGDDHTNHARAFAGIVLLGIALVGCRPAPRTQPVRRLQAVPGRAPVAVAPLPAVAPVEYRPVTPDEALRINAEPPAREAAGPPARPFAGAAAARPAALECLASAIYYEAASESDDGERAVAQVVLNRVRHPAFPASVCGVVYEGAERATGCQFTFACDGALLRRPALAGWRRAHRIAAAALQGAVFAPVGNATHYHANTVVPYWSSSLDRAATIGAHIFYRWPGRWGTPRAFFQRYAGSEPDISALVARWRDPALAVLPILAAPALLEDAKVIAAKPKPATLAADRESGGLVAPLRKPPQLEADRHKSMLRLDRARALTLGGGTPRPLR